nr:UDP-glycosyltransferase 73C3-like [Ipomoea batatas]
MVAVGMLRPQVEEAVKQSKPPPSCIVSDVCMTWMAEAVAVAAGLNIPRVMFNGSCCFSDVCATRITDSMILGKVGSELEEFTVPEVPHNIQVCKAQVKLCTTDLTLSDDDPRKQFGEKLMQGSKSAYGVIVNSFEEMEPDYVKEYRKMHHGRVWCVGPVYLCDQMYKDQLLRGNNNNYSDQECLKWLDLQAPGSVVYVSFGSMASLSPRQMAELALGLESNKRPFLWALGKKGKNVDAFEDWNVSSGFEQRNRGRGLLVRGWAPQVLILSHTSVGGFLTHCGWNSALEAISAKVPMVTWPLIAEHFLNEKLVVEVLGIGVSLGLKMYVDWNGEDKNDVVMAPGSVVYVSFGSMASLSPRQMAELALGLESNKRPFLWALGKKGKNVDAFEDWNVSSGFEQRNRGRGLLVRGWAPQVLILSHTSVGGFLTHCGWNSALEAISAKVPMVTWPLIAEHFLNEKLVVEVLGIGVSLGLKMYVDWNGEDKNDVVMVKNE